MGCGGSAAKPTSSEPSGLQPSIAKLTQEKAAIYEDRLCLATEVSQMKTYVNDMVMENEMLKLRVDRIMANYHPMVFQDSSSQDELIADWVEMDLRDGDRLLEALAEIHPESKEEIVAVLGQSTNLRKVESSLKQYCDYFSRRFEFFNEIWSKAFEAKLALEDVIKQFKSETASSVQSMESMLGKRSPPLEELQAQFRDLIHLSGAAFFIAYRKITLKLFGHKVDNFNKRLEDKDVEKQRVIAWYDTEIGKMKAAHMEELTQKDKERAKLTAELQSERDRLISNYEKTISELTARTDQDRDRLIWQYNEDRALLKSKLDRKTRELQEIQSTADKELQAVTKRAFEEKQAMTNTNERVLALKEKSIKDLREALAREAERREVEVKQASEGWDEQLQVLVNEHVQEFTKLRRKLDSETEKHDLAIRKVEAQHKQLLASMDSQHKQELEQLRASLTSEVQRREETLKKTQSDSQAYVSKMIEKHRDDMAKLYARAQEDLKRKEELGMTQREDHQKQLDSLSASHSAELEEMRKTLAEEIYKRDLAARKVEQDHQAALQELMDKFREDMEKLRVNQQREVRGKEEQLMDADRKNADLTEQYRQDLADIRTLHSEEIARREALLEKTKEEHRVYIDKLSQEFYTELAQLRTAHSEELRLREVAERKQESTHQSAIQEQMDKYREDTERMRLQFQADMQAKDLQLASAVQLHQQQMETFMLKADAEVTQMRALHAEEMRRKEDALDKTHESHRAEMRALLQKASQEAEAQQQLFSQDSREKALQLQSLQQDYEAKLLAQDKRHTTEFAEARKGFLSLLQQKEDLIRKIQEDNDVKFGELVEKYREDLTLARKQLESDSQRKEEHVDKAQAEYEQQLSEMVDRHSSDLARMRVEHGEELSRKEKLHRETLAAAETTLSANTAKFVAEIDSLRKQHSAELASRDEAAQRNRLHFDSQLQELRDSHFREIQNFRALQAEELQRRDSLANKLQEEQTAYVATIMDKYRADLTEARRMHQEDLERKEKELNSLQTDQQAAITALTRKHSEELTGLRTTHSEEIRRKETQIEALNHSMETRLRDLHSQQLVEIAQLKQGHVEELKSRTEVQQRLVAGYEAQVATLKEQFTREIQALQEQSKTEIERREDRIATLKREHKAQVEDMVGRVMQEAAAQRTAAEAEIRHKEELLDALRKENEKTVQSLKMSNLEAIKSMESAHALALAERSHKEKEQAVSLQRTLEEFLKQTAFIKALHQQDHVYDLHHSSPRVSPALSRMELEANDEGLYQKALAETQLALEKEKRALDLQLARDREVIRNLEQKLEETGANLDLKTQESQTAQERIAELEAALEAKNSEATALLASLDQTKSHLSQLQATCQSLRTSLDNSNAQLQSALTERQSLSTALAHCQSSLSVLQSDLASHKGLTTREQEELQMQLQRAQEDLSHRDSKITELAENMRGAESEFIMQMQRQTLKGILMRTILQIRSLKGKAVVIWRLSKAAQATKAPVSEETSGHGEAEQLWALEQRSLLDNNLLLDIFKKSSRGEPPLGLTQVLKFFEELMDHKAEADQLDLAAHRQPKTLQDFLLDYLTRTFGLRKLAVKLVCQLVPALIVQHREQQPEVVLFCRLLQMINPSPVNLPLAVFLTKVRIEFVKYGKNYQLEHGTSSSKAYLVDIFAYVYALFEDDHESGTDLLSRLRPASISLEEYILFCVCNKMAILSLNSEEVFSKMDLDASGRMSVREFINGVQHTMELWITDKDLESVFLHLAQGQGGLTKEEFIESLGFRRYVEKCKSEQFALTKTEFLSALIEVYTGKQIRNITRLLAELGAAAAIDRPMHDSLIERLNPAVDSTQSASIWERVSETAGNSKVPTSTYIKLLLRSSAVPQGVFGKSYSALEDLPLWTELSGSEDLRSDSSGTRRWVVREEA